jgi:hypothetical protein
MVIIEGRGDMGNGYVSIIVVGKLKGTTLQKGEGLIGII